MEPVKTQIWIAMLVAIPELKIDRLGEILQILSITLFEKVSMKYLDSQSCKQLRFNRMHLKITVPPDQ